MSMPEATKTNTTTDPIAEQDPAIADLIAAETKRQENTLGMIPSENAVSPAVAAASATVLQNKYAEGYPDKRYYQGNAIIDQIEQLAIDRAKSLFGADHANVQPNSGSPANQAVFMATMQPGDTFLGLDLTSGGHLTHGSPVNLSGTVYNAISYTVDETTERVDLDQVRALAKKHRPKVIISGWTAYPRTFDFEGFGEIAREVDAIHLADISHIAGLVAGGAHASPFPHADIVTTTTHKTLRGPRGALILTTDQYAKPIDKAVFPGLQGGPHEHSIAAKAIAFAEAATDDFKTYAAQIVTNAKALADSLQAQGLKLVTDGTDTHLLLIDLRPLGIGLGRQAAVSLEAAGIVTNANTVPYEPGSPFKPSGLRLGTPTLTTRGIQENEMTQIGEWISQIIKDPQNEQIQQRVRTKVADLCKAFPLPH